MEGCISKVRHAEDGRPPPEVGTDTRDGFLPRAFGGNMALLTPGSQTSGLFVPYLFPPPHSREARSPKGTKDRPRPPQGESLSVPA